MNVILKNSTGYLVGHLVSGPFKRFDSIMYTLLLAPADVPQAQLFGGLQLAVRNWDFHVGRRGDPEVVDDRLAVIAMRVPDEDRWLALHLESDTVGAGKTEAAALAALKIPPRGEWHTPSDPDTENQLLIANVHYHWRSVPCP